MTQLIAAIRRVAREVPGAAAVVAQHCRAHDYTRPGKPAIAWDDPAARDQLVDALVGDAHRLLGQMLDAAERAGHKPTIKPWPLRPSVEAGSPSTTSPSTKTPAPRPARTASRAR